MYLMNHKKIKLIPYIYIIYLKLDTKYVIQQSTFFYIEIDCSIFWCHNEKILAHASPFEDMSFSAIKGI